MCFMTFEVMGSRLQSNQRANNLRASKNLLNDGFCTARHNKARREPSRRLAQATARNYAA